MKKLKVILPAILTLAVSTSAAVTGTVAWFTATRLRTVEMQHVTAVNPESGLELISVINIANTKIERVDNEHKPLTGQNAIVTHSYDTTNDENGYLRDASVDLSGADPVVYKGILDRDGTGEITGYGTVNDLTVADVPTYNDKSVFFADAFSMTFAVANGDPTCNTGLFFDVKASYVSLPSALTLEGGASAADAKYDNDKNLYKAVRFGFKAGNEWFVWAPYTSVNLDVGEVATDVTSENWEAKLAAGLWNDIDCTDPAQGSYTAGTYYVHNTKRAKYVNGVADETADPVVNTMASRETPYEEENFIIGENLGESTDSVLNDNAGPIDNGDATDYIGYLGNLKPTGANATNITVKVYTWFEGLDPDCVNANFTTALSGLTSNLKFISRRFGD